MPTEEDKSIILNPPNEKPKTGDSAWNRYFETFTQIAVASKYLDLDDDCNATPIALLLSPGDTLTIRNKGVSEQKITLPASEIDDPNPQPITIPAGGSQKIEFNEFKNPRSGTISCEKKGGTIAMLRVIPQPTFDTSEKPKPPEGPNPAIPPPQKPLSNP